MSFPHLMKRSGYFYFRFAVPLSLVCALGKKELTYSLKTKDYAEAKVRCLTMLSATQEALQRSKMGDYAPVYNLKESLYTKQDNLSIIHFPKSTDKDRPNGHAKEEVLARISEVFIEYLAEAKGEGEKSKQRKQSALKLWLDVVGDIPVKSITKAEARLFKQILLKMPSNAEKRFKGKSVNQIDLDAIPQNQRLSITSINHYLGFMRAFCNWMIRNGYYEANNPFMGLSLRDNERAIEKKEPFSSEQLQAIFNSPIYTGSKSGNPHHRYIKGETIIKDGLYWVPLIALYSGARMQEICQLYVSDIKEIEGVWVFDINEEGADKQLKTSSSRRRTPIHPKLIELGLLNHRDEQASNGHRLFPDLPRGSNGTYSGVFSKRFNKFLKSMKIKTDKTSFHSFRHTFIDKLRAVGVQREIREALVGHLNQSKAHDNYGSIIGIVALYKAITKLER